MTRIKICGLSDIKSARETANAGADFIGLMFAASKRKVSLEKAREISEMIHKMDNPPALVGVFVNSTSEEVNLIADSCRLDWIQLSGDEDWQYCKSINNPIIKAIHIRESNTSEEIISEIESGYKVCSKNRLIYHLDTHHEVLYGGTGRIFNWQVAKKVTSRFPVMIAGGLTPGNVGQMIGEVHPWGVDVSSGVESEGLKDISKINSFISAVRESGKNNG